MNNDNDLNLHLHDQMSGWLRYWLFTKSFSIKNLIHRLVPFPPLYSILNSYLNEESIVYLQRYSISRKLQTALNSKKSVTCRHRNSFMFVTGPALER